MNDYTIATYIKLAKPYTLEFHLELNETATIRLLNPGTMEAVSLEFVDFDKIYQAIEELKRDLDRRNPDLGLISLVQYIDPYTLSVYYEPNVSSFVVTVSSGTSSETMYCSRDAMRSIGEHVASLKCSVIYQDEEKRKNLLKGEKE